MNLDVLNPHVMRILIAARREDSINSIAKRIDLSYGWTHKWVEELAKIGVFKVTRTKLFLQESNQFYRRSLDFIRKNFSKDVSFSYSVLKLFGVKYCFTKTDAVFVWTKGGYNIGRYKDYYPIFIKIRRADHELFTDYCSKLGLNLNAGEGVFYSPEIRDDFDVHYSDDVPVDSLEDTIEFMRENIYNFQPALEMIQKMYGKKLKTRYEERATNV